MIGDLNMFWKFARAISTTSIVGFARPLFVNGIGNPWPQLTWAVPWSRDLGMAVVPANASRT